MAQLHPQLAQDCLQLGRFPLSRLLLTRDAHYPWCILVPDREDVSEIHQLSEADRQQLLRESCLLAEAMERAFAPDKLNIAAIGNLVPQLHLHHVARFHDDASWPAPVWGRLPAKPYQEQELAKVVAALKRELGSELQWQV